MGSRSHMPCDWHGGKQTTGWLLRTKVLVVFGEQENKNAIFLAEAGELRMHIYEDVYGWLDTLHGLDVGAQGQVVQQQSNRGCKS